MWNKKRTFRNCLFITIVLWWKVLIRKHSKLNFLEHQLERAWTIISLTIFVNKQGNQCSEKWCSFDVVNKASTTVREMKRKMPHYSLSNPRIGLSRGYIQTNVGINPDYGGKIVGIFNLSWFIFPFCLSLKNTHLQSSNILKCHMLIL